MNQRLMRGHGEGGHDSEEEQSTASIKVKQQPQLLQTQSASALQSSFNGPKLEPTVMSPRHHHRSGCHVTKSSP